MYFNIKEPYLIIYLNQNHKKKHILYVHINNTYIIYKILYTLYNLMLGNILIYTNF